MHVAPARYVKPLSATCRVLLVAPGPDLGSELWATMLRFHSEHNAERLFELVYLDPMHIAEFLVSIDLLFDWV